MVHVVTADTEREKCSLAARCVITLLITRRGMHFFSAAAPANLNNSNGSQALTVFENESRGLQEAFAYIRGWYSGLGFVHVSNPKNAVHATRIIANREAYCEHVAI